MNRKIPVIIITLLILIAIPMYIDLFIKYW
jgi:hypothetical protein